MPEMLRTIISDLLRQAPDIVLVGRPEEQQAAPQRDSLQAAREAHADVLITQDRAGGANSCLDTILSAPPLGIFALSADGRNAAAVNLVRQPIALNGDRRFALVEAIRHMAENLNAHQSGGR